MNKRWIETVVNCTTARDQLLGDSLSPLAERAKQCQKTNKKLLGSASSNENTIPKVSKLLSTSSISGSTTNGQSFEANETTEFSYASTSWLSKSAKQTVLVQKKKEKKRGAKKAKKKRRALESLSDVLLESDNKTGNLMAELIKHSDDMVLVEDELWVYREETGAYHLYTCADVSKAIRSALPYEDQLKISSREYKESYEQLRISDELVHKDGFCENIPYVNCLNGVIAVSSGKLLEHSPSYYFRHCIQAEYKPGTHCPKFIEYVNYITGGDKGLIRLLRVMLGYIFSHYNNGKVAFLLFAAPHTGKSVLCNLIGHILGKEYVAHIDLSMLQKQEYVAALTGKMLNIAPDLKNEMLKDVGFFKSLVSHVDMISARSLYSNPREIQCGTKMLFSSNHFLAFDSSLGVYDIEAVFNRLIYFPFQNKPITDAQNNKHLAEELLEERDAIFTWGIKGLKDYIDNNECFPEADLSIKVKNQNMAQYCPEKVFFQACVKRKEGEIYESSSALKEAYADFCRKYDVKVKTNLATYLEEHEHLQKVKKRIDSHGTPTNEGNPIYAYKGIRLRKRYRSQTVEESIYQEETL